MYSLRYYQHITRVNLSYNILWFILVNKKAHLTIFNLYRFERRASQDCVGYQPPGGATVFGDPHIYTFDGMPYTFNGKGEYVLVRANSPKVKLDVQARFEQVLDSPYGEVKASMPTAFAAKDNVSATVEVNFEAFFYLPSVL